MVPILLAGFLLGILIALVNEGDFPEISLLILCLASAIFPTAVLNFFMPANLFFVGPVAGALCCALAIKLFLSVPLGKSVFAAVMYFVIQISLSMFLSS